MDSVHGTLGKKSYMSGVEIRTSSLANNSGCTIDLAIYHEQCAWHSWKKIRHVWSGDKN
jgi:hypothetical protein